MKEFAVFPLDLLLLGACQPAPAAEPTMPVAALPSPNVPGIGRALLVYEDLMNGFEFEEPQAESALTLPEGTIPAILIFEGRLELLGEKENGHIQLLRGETGPEYACLLVRRRGEGGQLHRRLPDPFWFVSLRPIDGSIGDASGKKTQRRNSHAGWAGGSVWDRMSNGSKRGSRHRGWRAGARFARAFTKLVESLSVLEPRT